MKGDLFINGKDAFLTWGVNMGDSFIETLLAPCPMKEVIENKSRIENGKRVILTDRKYDERELTLNFTLRGTSQADYLSKYKSFITDISSGEVLVKVPALGVEVYHLYYLRSASYGMGGSRTFSKISVKMNEPNPANRSSQV